MEFKYIISINEISDLGLNINEYSIDESASYSIIIKAYNYCTTNILRLNDDIKYYEDLIEILDKEPKLIRPFKELQWQVIYNLIFLGDGIPFDSYCESIVTDKMRLGKINGIQKRIYRG